MSRLVGVVLLLSQAITTPVAALRLRTRSKDPKSDLIADINTKEALIASLEHGNMEDAASTGASTISIDAITEPPADGSRQVPGAFPDQGLGGIPVGAPQGLQIPNENLVSGGQADITDASAASLVPLHAATPPESIAGADANHASLASYEASSPATTIAIDEDAAAPPPLQPLLLGKSASGSTFDPDADAGNPIVESSSTKAVWDDSEGGSVLVSKDSGKPVLDEPVITGTYTVDHLDDATLESLPTPLGHVPAKQLKMGNDTNHFEQGASSPSICSRECCTEFHNAHSSDTMPTENIADLVAISTDQEKQRKLFDLYRSRSGESGMSELIEKWEAASRRLMDLVEHAKSFDETYSASATGTTSAPVLMDIFTTEKPKVLELASTIETTEAPSADSGATGATQVDSATADAPNDDMEVTEAPVALELASTEAPAVDSEATAGPQVDSATTEAPAVDSVTTEAPSMDSQITQAQEIGERPSSSSSFKEMGSILAGADNHVPDASGQLQELVRRSIAEREQKDQMNKRTADEVRRIMDITNERVKIIQERGVDDIADLEHV